MKKNSLFNSYSSLNSSDLLFSFNFEGVEQTGLNAPDENAVLGIDTPIEGDIYFNYSTYSSFYLFIGAVIIATGLVYFIWSLQAEEKKVLSPLLTHDLPVLEYSENLAVDIKKEIVLEAEKSVPLISEKQNKTKEDYPIFYNKNIIPKDRKIEPKQPEDTSPKTVIQTGAYQTSDFSRAMELSMETGRYIFMKFGAKWCVPCKMMEEGALADEQVQALLQDHFIVLDIDVDKPENAKVKKDYYLSKLPTILILDQSANELKRKENSMNISAMRAFLEDITEMLFWEKERLTQEDHQYLEYSDK